MQCATCQKEVEASPAGDVPANCPSCGASLSAKRSGGAWKTILLSFLVVGLATFAAGSTLVALNTIRERDSLREDAAAATQVIDQIALAAANNAKLKGAANRQARKEILQPAVSYYESFAARHREDESMKPQVASALFHLAGLQASMGQGACAQSLLDAFEKVRLLREANVDPKSFPSLGGSALTIAQPMEWGMVSDAPLAVHAPMLLLAVQTADGELYALTQQHPQEPTFPSDRAALQRVSAILQTAVPGREDFALSAWKTVAEMLEPLAAAQPTNVEYQGRLIEALVGSAKLLKKAGKDGEAAPRYQRAIELQEKLVAAEPENKAHAKALEDYKKALANLKPAEAAPESADKPAEAPAEEPAAAPAT
jgi:tetratricopeptide (TPR) repeat protein